MKKIEKDCNCGFSKLASLTVFQSSFFLFVTFHIMLADQNYLTQSCDFVSYKKFICLSQVPQRIIKDAQFRAIMRK